MEAKKNKRKAKEEETPTPASKKRKTTSKISVSSLGKRLAEEDKMEFLDKCASMSMKELIPIIDELVEERNEYRVWKIEV